MKSKVIMPSYIQTFKCIASECEETCCAGWYIAIDEVTYKKYKKVKAPEMKRRLEKELVVKRGAVQGSCAAKIKLKNNRCAFLAQNNLCDIYTELGENYLSETCKMYPRNTNQLGERVELSLALSCPEAARQILLREEPITFKEEMIDQLPIVGADLKMNAKQPKQFEDLLVPIRQVILEILQNKALNFKEKWQCLEGMMKELSDCQRKCDIKKLQILLKAMQNKAYLKYQEVPLSLERKRLLSGVGAEQLLEALGKLCETKKWPSARYAVCYDTLLRGVGKPFNLKIYQEAEKQYEDEVIKNFSYILENYFVNYVYERLVPLNQKTVLESFNEMTLYLALLKLHFIGYLALHKQIQKDEIVTCIQSFTRVFDHNELYIQQIKKQINHLIKA